MARFYEDLRVTSSVNLLTGIEHVGLLGLSIGGHLDVAERVIDDVRVQRPDLTVFAGGVAPSWACRRLAQKGVEV